MIKNNKFYKTYGYIRSNYKSNYMHANGLRSLIDCLFGTVGFKHFNKKNSIKTNKINFLTFSVIPSLTNIWAWYIKNIDLYNINNIIIGDCSGGLKTSSIINHNERIPYLNYIHGEKIDFFLAHTCSTKYVVICDDDIIWTSQKPLLYALDKFKGNPKLAVVSLVPSKKKSFWLSNATKIAMGSYCIVIDRQKWISEKLSFQIHKPVGWRTYGHYLDTADHANLELLKKDYDICIASQDIQDLLVKFTGLSMWALRIQKSLGEINDIVRDRPDEYKKVYRVAKTLLELNKLSDDLKIINPNLFFNKSCFTKSIRLAKNKISKSTINQINYELRMKVEKLRNAFHY